ncbi:TSR1 Ribosome biogenesis protein TSR1 [Candida maltosa Xu316]|uniref:Ribosome biogenesis protein TSR1 n=1 Tax=Candida maltosa (strain Xu316) TaxID=1245528 RepID=M3HL53_CANMX|nr:Ribosome biogenesis protein TSR1 [Candida maltosa Xu316]
MSHRNTLKHDHKPFKSKHASKGQIKNRIKGKVEKSSSSGPKIKTVSKLERKNLAKQQRDNKILESKITRKLFDGNQGAEKIVSIIALTNDLSPVDIANRLFNQDNDDKQAFTFEFPSVTNINISKFKSNIKVIIPDQNNMLNILDAARVADFVVFGISATQEIEQGYGETILRALIAQGISTVIGVLPNVVSAYPKRNLQLDIKQSLSSYFQHFFPSDDKLYSLEIDSDNSNCLRTICQKFPQSITWRDTRGWLVADRVSADDEHVIVEGMVRGVGFSANRLVHIPGFGDYQVDKLEKIINKKNNRGSMDVEDDVEQVYTPNENQETLDELNPEEVEMEDMEDDGDFWGNSNGNELGVRSEGKIYFDDDGTRKLPTRRLVPKGTSEYQGRWFVDDVLDEDASDLEEQIEGEEGDEQQLDEMEMEMEVEGADTATEYGESEMHVDLSPEEEERQLQEFRSLEKDDLEFPDEMELHPNESAKDRLSAYRGVKSLANCDWDVDEYDAEAPSVWNRLLRVSNYKATKNKLNKTFIKDTEVTAGNRVRLFIKAPLFILEKVNSSALPFTIYELLEHEHKLAVCNFSFESWEDYEKPIPNKEQLIVQYGPRRQIIQPLFNQASNNPNNVHKSENFAHLGATSIATAIAPVLFTNSPTLYFKPGAQPGSLEFVGKGTFLGCDHTRIVAQRAVLTGHPVKIHKRVVTVRYMFFNPEDINFFKAITLFTKSGRTGFIKESLGTHGYFKANFDGKLTSQDVVAMSLYKRVWPEISSAWTE